MSSQATRQEQLADLRKHAGVLLNQMEEIQNRIEELQDESYQ